MIKSAAVMSDKYRETSVYSLNPVVPCGGKTKSTFLTESGTVSKKINKAYLENIPWPFSSRVIAGITIDGGELFHYTEIRK